MANALFCLQIVFTTIFGVTQFRKLKDSAEGISAVWYATWLAFNALNLWLVVGVYVMRPSFTALQPVIVYWLWLLLVGAILTRMAWSRRVTWTRTDSKTAALVAVGVGATLLVALLVYHTTITHPLTKGTLAFFCKTIPQFGMAYKMKREGGKGMSGWTLFSGHVTVLTRIAQVVFIQGVGQQWNLNLLGVILSEGGNEISWIAVTAVWLFVR